VAAAKHHSLKSQVCLYKMTFEYSHLLAYCLAGNQRPPATPKEPTPNEKPPSDSQTKPSTTSSNSGTRGTTSSSSGSNNSWRGLEFKFTPGDKNSFFNNRAAIAILLSGAIVGYFAYNDALYREVTWKDFVSQYLLKGYVRCLCRLKRDPSLIGIVFFSIVI
jgi:hypothetical protein